MQAITLRIYKTDIASTESVFGSSYRTLSTALPQDVAVDRFSKKIEEVATRSDELNSAEAELKLLNAKIETDQSNLKAYGKTTRNCKPR